MAGISSAGAAAATHTPPPDPPAAEGHGGGAATYDDNDDNDNDYLSMLLERFPDLFALKVLVHLDPIDRSFLAQAGSTCRTAVANSDLPREGTRRVELGRAEWVVRHKISEFCTSIERLAWAKASGCPWIARTCMMAAQGGRLEVLRWARENDCPWNVWTAAHAAAGGHLKVLQWARAHDCPWTEWICYRAARGGHLAVLQWAREHGCKWDKRECEAIADYRNHPETLAWVRAQP
jgi:hypothetical protein